MLLSVSFIVVVQAGAYYYFEKSYFQSSGAACSTTNKITNSSAVTAVQTLINYGNGASEWFNWTNVPSNWNFYTITTDLGIKVEAQFYGFPTCEHFVTGIGGIRNSGQSDWTLWVLCQKDSAWTVPAIGADLLGLSSYHTFAWYYQAIHSQDQSTWNPPVVGSRKVVSCV